MRRNRRLFALAIFAVLVPLLAACGSSGKPAPESVNAAGRRHVQEQNKSFAPPVIKNDVEYHNYIGAQRVYDDPSTIIFCTTTWGNASAPLVTVPVAGKLTSSSVSLFPSTQAKIDSDGYDTYNPELPSVDGMFHGAPPPYRYGFTPGGQYVDFFNMPTFCTTALTSFQRQETKVSVSIDPAMLAAQKAAQAALKVCQAGNSKTETKSTACPAAQQALLSGLGQ